MALRAFLLIVGLLGHVSSVCAQGEEDVMDLLESGLEPIAERSSSSSPSSSSSASTKKKDDGTKLQLLLASRDGKQRILAKKLEPLLVKWDTMKEQVRGLKNPFAVQQAVQSLGSSFKVIENVYKELLAVWAEAEKGLQSYKAKYGQPAFCDAKCEKWIQGRVKVYQEHVRTSFLNIVRVRNREYTISIMVIYSFGLCVLGLILVLAFAWKLVSRATAPTVATLIVLMVACLLQVGGVFPLVLQGALPTDQWAIYILLERLASVTELVVVLLFFMLWSKVASEMSGAGDSRVWVVIRLVAIVLAIVTICIDVISASVYSAALRNPNVNGNWTPFAFILNGVVRLLLAAGLMVFFLYAYVIAKKSSWGAQMLPAFHRMLFALGLLTISCILFCIQTFFASLTVGTDWLRIPASALLILSLSFGFLSYFKQVREGVRRVDQEAEGDSRKSLLECEDERSTTDERSSAIKEAEILSQHYDY